MAKKQDERDLKAKALGAIKCLEVDDKRLYLKVPNRHAIGIAFAKSNSNIVEGYEVFAKNAAIREVSDMEIIEKDDLFLSVMSGIAEFMGEIQLKKSTSRIL